MRGGKQRNKVVFVVWVMAGRILCITSREYSSVAARSRFPLSSHFYYHKDTDVLIAFG